jgi:hypothetical protein
MSEILIRVASAVRLPWKQRTHCAKSVRTLRTRGLVPLRGLALTARTHSLRELMESK